MPIELIHINSDWIFYLMLCQLLLCALVINFYSRQVSRLGLVIFSQSKARQLLTDENPFHFRSVYILMVLSLSVISLYGLLTLQHLAPGTDAGMKKYGHFFIFFFLFYIGRTLVHKINGYLFNLNYLASHYILLFFNVSILAGILLFPVNIFIMYFLPGYPEIFIWAGAGIVFLTWVYQLITGFIAGTGINKIHPLYMFLYLCTVEILPVAVLSKFFLSTLISVSISTTLD